jgi:hypothetical protein
MILRASSVQIPGSVAENAAEQAIRNLSTADKEALMLDIKLQSATLEFDLLRIRMVQDAVEKFGGDFSMVSAAEKEAIASATNIDVEALEADVAKMVNLEQKIVALDKAEVSIMEAARSISKATWILLGASILVIAGVMIWEKVKEKEIKAELQEAIKSICTSRLYSLMAEQMVLTHTDQMSTIKMLAAAYAGGKKDNIEFIQNQFVEGVNEAIATITEEYCYNLLKEQDEKVKAKTEEDPSLADMKKRHKAVVEKAEKEAVAKAGKTTV